MSSKTTKKPTRKAQKRSSKPQQFQLRCLVLRDSQLDVFVAMGLEHFITGQGETPQAALESLVMMLGAHLSLCDTMGEDFSKTAPAPQRFHKMHEKAEWMWRMSQEDIPTQKKLDIPNQIKLHDPKIARPLQSVIVA